MQFERVLFISRMRMETGNIYISSSSVALSQCRRGVRHSQLSASFPFVRASRRRVLKQERGAFGGVASKSDRRMCSSDRVTLTDE